MPPDARALAAGDADRLEAGRRLREGHLLQAAGEPHARRGPLHDAALLVDDEERDPVRADPVVGRARHDGDVLARRAPERLERRPRRGRRRGCLGRRAVTGVPASATGNEDRQHDRRGMQLPTVSQAQGSRSEGRCGS